jgi:hypothetical protein
VHFFKVNQFVKTVPTSYQHLYALCGYFILIVNQCFMYFIHIVWKTSTWAMTISLNFVTPTAGNICDPGFGSPFFLFRKVCLLPLPVCTGIGT